jgi:hypothetical protein
MPRCDSLAATGNFLFQPPDALLQFMRGKRGNIFAQHNVRQFLAWLQIVQVHRVAPALPLVWCGENRRASHENH